PPLRGRGVGGEGVLLAPSLLAPLPRSGGEGGRIKKEDGMALLGNDTAAARARRALLWGAAASPFFRARCSWSCRPACPTGATQSMTPRPPGCGSGSAPRVSGPWLSPRWAVP